MYDDNSYDSTTTKQKKSDWRATKLAEEIWKKQGFDIQMDEPLIHLWVNPISRLIDVDYAPHQTFVMTRYDMY